MKKRTAASPERTPALPDGHVCLSHSRSHRVAVATASGRDSTPIAVRQWPAVARGVSWPVIRTMKSTLDERRPSASPTLISDPVATHSLIPISMTTTKSRIFPKHNADGIIENVAIDAFDPIKTIVEEEYDDAIFEVADEDGPAVYPMGFVPFPHLIVSITADEEQVFSIISRINGMLEQVIKQYTRPVAVTE